MKYYYEPETREPITGVLPSSVTLPYKLTPPPSVEKGQYVLAGDADDWVVHDMPVDNSARIAELKLQLKDIDAQSARPMRAILGGDSSQDDMDELNKLELLAKQLRGELLQLSS